MPRSILEEFPFIETKEAFFENLPLLAMYFQDLHHHVYGIGTDITGGLDRDNLANVVMTGDEDLTITGTWTFSTHPLDLDHTEISNIGSNTHAGIDSHIADATIHFTEASIDHSDIDELAWSVAGHTIDGNIAMADNSVTGINTLTFNDVNGTIAGIQNQNLLDKTATETITAAWIMGTASSLRINDSIQVKFGSDSDYTFQWDNVNGVLVGNNAEADVDVRFAAVGNTNAVCIQGSSGYFAIGTPDPERALHVVGQSMLDAFGEAANFRGRRANGTIASPSAVLINDIIANYNFGGYHSSSAYHNGKVIWRVKALENWTSSASGCSFEIRTGNVGATTTSSRVLYTDGVTTFNDNKNDINLRMHGDTNDDVFWFDAGVENITINASVVSANYDLMLAGDGVLGTKETTTPTADTNYGKWYTKSDNKAYFQDGGGTEHELAYV